MKYLLIISALILSSCGTTSYLVDSSQCDKYEPSLLFCNKKGSVQKVK
jgi:hypothetical protein